MAEKIVEIIIGDRIWLGTTADKIEFDALAEKGRRAAYAILDAKYGVGNWPEIKGTHG